MSEFTDTLTQKAGPLPVWAWGAIAGGGIVVFRFVKSRTGDAVEAPSELESAESADSPTYYAPYAPDLLTRRPDGGAIDIPYYNPPETVTPDIPTAEEIAEEIVSRYPVPEPPPERDPLKDFIDYYTLLFPYFSPTPQPNDTPAAPAPVAVAPAPTPAAPTPTAPTAPRTDNTTSRTPKCQTPKGTIVWRGKNRPNMATLRAAYPYCMLDDRERGGGEGWVVVVV